MSRWYWAAVACAVCFVITLLMPAYVTKEWGGVWWWQIGRGWNDTDPDGNPRHDDLGNRIWPNHVRTVALYAFGAGTVGLAVAGYLSPKKRRRQSDSPTDV
jgi:hypothetical protein